MGIPNTSLTFTRFDIYNILIVYNKILFPILTRNDFPALLLLISANIVFFIGITLRTDVESMTDRNASIAFILFLQALNIKRKFSINLSNFPLFILCSNAFVACFCFVFSKLVNFTCTRMGNVKPWNRIDFPEKSSVLRDKNWLNSFINFTNYHQDKTVVWTFGKLMIILLSGQVSLVLEPSIPYVSQTLPLWGN